MKTVDLFNQMFNIYKSSLIKERPAPGIEELTDPVVKSLLYTIALSNSKVLDEIRELKNKDNIKT